MKIIEQSTDAIILFMKKDYLEEYAQTLGHFSIYQNPEELEETHRILKEMCKLDRTNYRVIEARDTAHDNWLDKIVVRELSTIRELE